MLSAPFCCHSLITQHSRTLLSTNIYNETCCKTLIILVLKLIDILLVHLSYRHAMKSRTIATLARWGRRRHRCLHRWSFFFQLSSSKLRSSKGSLSKSMFENRHRRSCCSCFISLSSRRTDSYLSGCPSSAAQHPLCSRRRGEILWYSYHTYVK